MPTSCTLTKGTGIVNACSFSWTPAKGTEGSYSITATYGGDSTHGPSSTHGSLTIGKRSVSVTVSCTSPYTHSVATTCTVTVTDNSPGTPLTPTGTVTFTSSGPGGFSSASCTLSGGGATASCHVKFTPSSKGSYTVTANYAGDKDHASGAGSITFKVS
jgi:Flp pilus assembly protein TadG